LITRGSGGKINKENKKILNKRNKKINENRWRDFSKKKEGKRGKVKFKWKNEIGNTGGSKCRSIRWVSYCI
jgi:hypothetical protein